MSEVNSWWEDYACCGPCRLCEGTGSYFYQVPENVDPWGDTEFGWDGGTCPLCEGTGHCNCEECKREFEDKDPVEEYEKEYKTKERKNGEGKKR